MRWADWRRCDAGPGSLLDQGVQSRDDFRGEASELLEFIGDRPQEDAFYACFAERVDPETANRAYVLLLIANHEAIDLDVKQSWIDTAAECTEETYGPGTPVTFE